MIKSLLSGTTIITLARVLKITAHDLAMAYGFVCFLGSLLFGLLTRLIKRAYNR